MRVFSSSGRVEARHHFFPTEVGGKSHWQKISGTRRSLGGLSAIALVLTLSACEGSKEERPASPDAGSPSAEKAAACRSLFDGGLSLQDSGATPSFRGEVMRMFGSHCNFGGCHVGHEGTGPLQLGDECTFDFGTGVCVVEDASVAPDIARAVHANLLAHGNAAPELARVAPGDPENSFILMKLSGCQNAFPEKTGCTHCGSSMPGGGNLRKDEPELFELLVRWIAGGAPLD